MRKRTMVILVLFVVLLAACGLDDYEYDDPAVAPEATYENLVESEGCLPHEEYDAETDTCYVDISCETEAECEEILASLYDGYDVELEEWEMVEEDCASPSW